MKKIIISTLVLTLVVLTIGVVSVSAQGGPGGAGQGFRVNDSQHPYYQQNDVNYLDLNDEQAEKTANFRDEFFDKREDLVEELQDKRAELREAILKDESDEVISGLENELSDLQNKVTEARTDYLKNMRSILNEEQVNIILESKYSFGMRSGFGYGVNSPTVNKMPMFGNRFNQFQGRSFRSPKGMMGGFRTPARGYCY
ncbi:MAG TPA: periplasmic heavy metal sensor [Halanaerobiales bacterium]|nr:periplasmic heavy metal sensor [Halanaerobiales bacterium]